MLKSPWQWGFSKLTGDFGYHHELRSAVCPSSSS